MKISHQEVLRIAGLAHLNLTPDEQANMVVHLQRILDYVEKLNELDPEISDTEPDSITQEEAWREDQTGPSLKKQDALRNAPQKSGSYFAVPKVI